MANGGELYMGTIDDPDRYRLWRRIGAGGEGTVWQGTRELIDGTIHVAVKHYHADRFGLSEPLAQISARLETQAARLRQLHTPGLAVVHESFLGAEPHAAGQADPALLAAYFVMDFVDGRPLPEWALDERSTPRQLAVLEDAAAALDTLHRAGQVHADIKPGNLLVHNVELPDHTLIPVAVLVDFGVMRAVTHQPPSKVVGTDGFLAPELRQGGAYTPASDLYAFAMVCAGIICGGRVGHDIADAARAAHLGEESVAVLLAGLHPDPRHRTDQLSAGVAGWLSRLRSGFTTSYGSPPGPAYSTATVAAPLSPPPPAMPGVVPPPPAPPPAPSGVPWSPVPPGSVPPGSVPPGSVPPPRPAADEPTVAAAGPAQQPVPNRRSGWRLAMVVAAIVVVVPLAWNAALRGGTTPGSGGAPSTTSTSVDTSTTPVAALTATVPVTPPATTAITVAPTTTTRAPTTTAPPDGTRAHPAMAPRTLKGDGLTYVLTDLAPGTLGGKGTLTITAEITRSRVPDFSLLQYHYFDQAGNELEPLPFNGSGNDNPPVNIKSRVVTVVGDADASIRTVTIVIHEWYSKKDYTLRDVPVLR